jgi:hypothetical protein
VADGYFLGLGKDLEPSTVLDAIRDLVGGEYSEEGGGLRIDDGLFVTCRRVTDPEPWDLFREEWGFEAPIRVGFAVGHKGEPDVGLRHASEDRTAVAAVGVAVRFDSDAGFSFQSGRKLFLRRDGQLTLYGDWRPWGEEQVLSRIPDPHTREPTPPVE